MNVPTTLPGIGHMVVQDQQGGASAQFSLASFIAGWHRTIRRASVPKCRQLAFDGPWPFDDGEARRNTHWVIRHPRTPIFSMVPLPEALAGTELEKARCVTIRLKLLKIGAQVRVTVRKVWVSLAGSYPRAALFAQVLAALGTS